VYNGNFGDAESAPVSYYRPQLSAFMPTNDSFDLILLVSNDAYAIGGMWESIIFGTYQQVLIYNKLISIAGALATAGLIVVCLLNNSVDIILRIV